MWAKYKNKSGLGIWLNEPDVVLILDKNGDYYLTQNYDGERQYVAAEDVIIPDDFKEGDECIFHQITSHYVGYKDGEQVKVKKAGIAWSIVTDKNDLEQYVHNCNLTKIGGDNMIKIGDRVVATRSTNLYTQGMFGTVHKLRDDVDGANYGIKFDDKEKITFLKPTSFELLYSRNDDCDGQIIIISSGYGYNKGDVGTILSEVRGGVLVDFQDDDGKPVFVMDGHYEDFNAIQEPLGQLKIYNLQSLRSRGWEFDKEGKLRLRDTDISISGSELNLIDMTLDYYDYDDDNYMVEVDGTEYAILKELERKLFKKIN